VQIALDVFTAVRFLHVGSKEVGSCFHRDIKPANILIKCNFTAQLTDCGTAIFATEDLYPTTTGATGTPGYRCPAYADGAIAYSEGCDIYSFGVVLTELWTGRLQNFKDEQGLPFNFANQYVFGIGGTIRDILQDIDPALDCEHPLRDSVRQFAALALKCMNRDVEHRPKGEQLLKDLQSISESFYSTEDLKRLDCLRGKTDSKSSQKCAICRSAPTVQSCTLCARCSLDEMARNVISRAMEDNMAELAAISKQLMEEQSKGFACLSLQVKGVSTQVHCVEEKIDMMLPVLAHMDVRLNNQVPRMFVLLPADIVSGWKHPKSWLRSMVQKKFYLYFYCPVAKETVSPPIELSVAKDWVRKVAPVLATGLFLVQIALKVGLQVSLDLDGSTKKKMFELTSDHIREMVDELSALLNETGHAGLLDRLATGELKVEDVQELNGHAYELVLEKACEQDGWRSQMEPVRIPPNPKVFWVSKAASADPKYAIVKS
jgi:Protein kinase domain